MKWIATSLQLVACGILCSFILDYMKVEGGVKYVVIISVAIIFGSWLEREHKKIGL